TAHSAPHTLSLHDALPICLLEPASTPRSIHAPGAPIARSAATNPSAFPTTATRPNLGPGSRHVAEVQEQPPDLPEQNAQDHNTRDASEPHPDPPHRPPPRPEPQAACGEDRSLYPKRRFL